MLSVDAKDAPEGQLQLHASSVAFRNKALVLAGPSGSGKSTLALRLLALGAELVSDDVTWLAPTKDGIEGRCPPSLTGRIEVRGLGILNVPMASPCPISSIVDLGVLETERIPPSRTISLLGQEIELLHKVETPYFAEALLHYLMYGRSN